MHVQQSLSNRATLFAKKLWSHWRGGLWWEGEVNTLIIVAAKIYGLIREGGLCWEWPLREGLLYVSGGGLNRGKNIIMVKYLKMPLKTYCIYQGPISAVSGKGERIGLRKDFSSLITMITLASIVFSTLYNKPRSPVDLIFYWYQATGPAYACNYK